MNRRPSPPPVLPGFTYVEPLGTGRFADVFLSQPDMPRRRVPVKWLLADRPPSAPAQEVHADANATPPPSTPPPTVPTSPATVSRDAPQP